MYCNINQDNVELDSCVYVKTSIGHISAETGRSPRKWSTSLPLEQMDTEHVTPDLF